MIRTIAYYISDYGYGHATRSVAIILRLLQRREDVRIIVCHSFALSFLQHALQDFAGRIQFHEVQTDVGYVLQHHSLQIDEIAIQEQVREYLNNLPQLVQQEVTYLEKLSTDMIISDITPMAFEVADQLHIASIGISNFTWHTAYTSMLDPQILKQLEVLYHKMDYFLALAGSVECNWGRNENVAFGFYSRNIKQEEVERIRRSLNPGGTKNIIFVPIGMKINLGDLSHLSLWNQPNCIFVVSSNMECSHPNVVRIEPGYTEVQHYVAASDLVISKAGWGTVSEAIGSGIPLLLIQREGMNEDENTIRYLLDKQYASVLSWEQINTIHIDTYIKSLKKPTSENEVDKIISAIIHVIDSKEKEG